MPGGREGEDKTTKEVSPHSFFAAARLLGNPATVHEHVCIVS
jgi:hypothetical protein